MSANGKVVQIIGPVIDVEFPADTVPDIYTALQIDHQEEGGVHIKLTAEVQQQIGRNQVRAVAMSTTDGLVLNVPFPLPETNILEVYGTLPARQTSVRIALPHYDTANLTMKVPEGYTWDSEAMVIEDDGPFGRYELKVEPGEDRFLSLSRTVYLKAQFITPEDYPAFLAFGRAMMDHERNLKFKASKNTGQP